MRVAINLIYYGVKEKRVHGSSGIPVEKYFAVPFTMSCCRRRRAPSRGTSSWRPHMMEKLATRMGGLWSFISGNQDDPKLDVKDEKTGLTPRQKQSIQKSWKVIIQDVKQNGIDLFVIFFTNNPTYQDFFTALQGLTMEELKKSPRLRAHALTVMRAITSIVENLDDPECLVELLVKTGKSHRVMKIQMPQFKNLMISIMEFLEEKLGNDFTPFVKEAWSTACDVILAVIRTGLEDPKDISEKTDSHTQEIQT